MQMPAFLTRFAMGEQLVEQETPPAVVVVAQLNVQTQYEYAHDPILSMFQIYGTARKKEPVS